jgi:glycine/D-amino acid oxidase-like deaminating enzyme
VIVVGGGIVGSAVAYFLAEAGVRDVVLLERGTVGCEASGLSAGTIWNAGTPSNSSPVRAEDATLFLRSRSASLLEALGGCEFNRCGALDVAATPAEAKLLLADFEQQRRQGLAVEWLGHSTAIAKVEPALAGGSALCATHTPLSGSVQPGLAAQRFAAEAAASGCSVIEGADVVSIRRHGHGSEHSRTAGGSSFEVATADGRRFAARHVVIAAGAAAAPLADKLGVALPVVAVKGVVCTSVAHAEPGALRKVIFDMGSRLWFSEHGSGRDDTHGVPAKCTHDGAGVRRCRKLYGKQCGPSDGHMLLFGGDRISGLAAGDYQVPAASAASIRANVRELLPGLRGFVEEEGEGAGSEAAGSWAGLMPFSADGRPIVGPLHRDLGLDTCWLAVGFGPAGIMEGPYAAKLLAGRIAAHDRHLKGQSAAILPVSEDEADRAILASLEPRERVSRSRPTL